jgi:hypothetical protein
MFQGFTFLLLHKNKKIKKALTRFRDRQKLHPSRDGELELGHTRVTADFF